MLFLSVRGIKTSGMERKHEINYTERIKESLIGSGELGLHKLCRILKEMRKTFKA